MDAAITPMMQKHYPVLLKEIISIISPQYGGTFIDCTFGQGGYTKKILEFDKTKVIALDRDPESEKVALKFQEKFEDIHLNIEKKLFEIIGPAAGFLHTARSRNDQVVTDFKLWIKKSSKEILKDISLVMKNLIKKAEKNTDTVMPG